MEKDIREEVRRRENEYVKFLGTLVGFDTSVIRHGEDGQEQKAQEFLAGYLEKNGLSDPHV